MLKAGPVKQQQLPVHGRKGIHLIPEQDGGKPGIGNRVVDTFLHQFIIFHQPMVGIPGKGQGRQPQGIHDGFLKKSQIRGLLGHDRQIMEQDVVTGNAVGPMGKGIQILEGGQGIEPSFSFKNIIPPHGPHLDDISLGNHFQVKEDRVF